MRTKILFSKESLNIKGKFLQFSGSERKSKSFVFSALMNLGAAAAFHASVHRFCTVFRMDDFDYLQILKSFSLSRFEYISWKSVVLFFSDLIVDLHVAF